MIADYLASPWITPVGGVEVGSGRGEEEQRKDATTNSDTHVRYRDTHMLSPHLLLSLPNASRGDEITLLTYYS